MLVVKWVCISITSVPVSVTDPEIHYRFVARILSMRLFKITACIPSPEKVRSQRELQNTYFTKWVPYDSWFAEQQRIMKQGGKILKVELATGRRQQNVGN